MPNHNNLDHNPEKSNHSTHSHNTGRHRNNPNLERENLKEAEKRAETAKNGVSADSYTFYWLSRSWWY